MKSSHLLAAFGLAILLPGTTPPALAGPGHAHGDAAPVSTGEALPRFAAVSKAFEMVGVLDGRQLTLYLDRAADNTPVTDAQIELEIAGTKVQARKHDDAYEVVLAAAPPPGVLPITATVTAGQEVDLLAGELDLHEPAIAAEAAHLHGWQATAGWAAAALAGLVALIAVGRRLAAGRQRRAGVAA